MKKIVKNNNYNKKKFKNIIVSINNYFCFIIMYLI